MNTTVVAGPFDNEIEARETMIMLGDRNHSVFSRAKNKTDENGEEYTDFDDCIYFVERLDDVLPERIFGMRWEQLNGIQHKQPIERDKP